ncbi:MAG TPA: hypothetical protein VHC22_34350 [Pirellulales bacterium]|nr:hypothetical protein [Pirellulales bacterium]
MALLMEPGGQVNGERRFADSALTVGNGDNHGATLHHLPASWQALFAASCLERELGCEHESLHATLNDGVKAGCHPNMPVV